MITRKQFEAYERVRVSGVTNMWDVRMVVILSGLREKTIMEIIKQYTELAEKYSWSMKGE